MIIREYINYLRNDRLPYQNVENHFHRWHLVSLQSLFEQSCLHVPEFLMVFSSSNPASEYTFSYWNRTIAFAFNSSYKLLDVFFQIFTVFFFGIFLIPVAFLGAHDDIVRISSFNKCTSEVNFISGFLC